MLFFFFQSPLTCSVMLWGGRNTANKYHWHVWGVLTVSPPHWVCPPSRLVCIPSLHCSGFRLLCWELSEVGPGLYALPRSKSLRFRFSGITQTDGVTHQLGWRGGVGSESAWLPEHSEGTWVEGHSAPRGRYAGQITLLFKVWFQDQQHLLEDC